MVLALALVAAAPERSPCREARAAYDALSLERALALAEVGLAREEPDALICLEARALALLVSTRLPEAREALRVLFQRDPTHAIDDPSLSPPLVAEVTRAREEARPPSFTGVARWLDPERVALRLRSDRPVLDGDRLRVLAIDELPGVPPQLLPLRDGTATATIVVPTGRLVTALHVRGTVESASAVLLRFQAEARLDPLPPVLPLPRSMLADPRPNPPDERSGSTWWIWAGAAAALIGGGVAAAFLLQPGPPTSVGLGRVNVDR